LVFFIAFAACAAVTVAVKAQNPSPKQSAWDGVYTDAQATRGERTYGRSCESCHGPDLAGDPVMEIPALSLDSFTTSLSGKTVKDVAYLLQANKFPSGARDLPRAPEQLESMAIERSK
jgi:cytochrome c